MSLIGLIQIIVKFRAEKKLCTFLLSFKHLSDTKPFERHEILCKKYHVGKIPLKENKLTCFTNSEDAFQVHNLVYGF